MQPFKAYHLGFAAGLERANPGTPLSLTSMVIGLTPWFALTPDLSSGAIEVGADLMFPLPFENALYPARGLTSTTSPMLVQPHLKLGLIQETSTLPGLALGAHSLALPDWDHSANLVHLSVTKAFEMTGVDLGQWTVGAYHGNPSVMKGPAGLDASNGWMAGYFRNLPFDLYALADYTSGEHRTGGLNLALGWAINEKLSLTVGGFTSNAGATENKVLLFLDYVDSLEF